MSKSARTVAQSWRGSLLESIRLDHKTLTPYAKDVAMIRHSRLLVVGSLMAIPGILCAETHRLTPQQFHNTFSAAHPPVMRVRPGIVS